MKKPADLLGEGDGVEGDSDSYCATERELGFRLDGSRSVAVGDEVRLRVGDPIEVLSGGNLIGTLEAREGQSMKSCIAMGYRMEGEVTSIDIEAQRGRIRVSGTQEGESA
ncbi:MAG TPA: hypothetical protein VMS11_10295 [Solirubrobacterales bacterium]|nr:hypothetical protein [Solirubrobacterales bacterium]